MQVLVDANILLRIVETQSPRHSDAVRSTRLLNANHSLISIPQVAYEFWAVATPTATANGLGMSVEEADQSLAELLEMFPPLLDERGIMSRWRDLVRKYGVKGVKSYDTRIAAAMKRHGIAHILTFNADDFEKYDGIIVLSPEVVVAGKF